MKGSYQLSLSRDVSARPAACLGFAKLKNISACRSKAVLSVHLPVYPVAFTYLSLRCTHVKEQLVRGKRLFNAACASCHVGGGTRTNQNVGLAIEELSGGRLRSCCIVRGGERL